MFIRRKHDLPFGELLLVLLVRVVLIVDLIVRAFNAGCVHYVQVLLQQCYMFAIGQGPVAIAAIVLAPVEIFARIDAELNRKQLIRGINERYQCRWAIVRCFHRNQCRKVSHIVCQQQRCPMALVRGHLERQIHATERNRRERFTIDVP
uniref:Putative secreted peptide n=1 Tax=Anopheles braziliensis TaxID=58242 RepID=A0A2M3ZQ71_9DIPT